MLKVSTEPNITEQMVLFGRFRQVFWLLVVPSGVGKKLRPQIGRTPLHQTIFNVDPFLYVGGHEDWHAHPALYNYTGFKGIFSLGFFFFLLILFIYLFQFLGTFCSIFNSITFSLSLSHLSLFRFRTNLRIPKHKCKYSGIERE